MKKIIVTYVIPKANAWGHKEFKDYQFQSDGTLDVDYLITLISQSVGCEKVFVIVTNIMVIPNKEDLIIVKIN